MNFWSFCGMGPYVIAVPYDGTTTGPFVWAQQGQNNSFVQPTNAPGARIGAIVGQFLMVGDVLQAQTQVIGTGDGVKATFNFGLNDLPMLSTGNVYDQNGLLAGTFQNGQIVGSGLLGTANLPGTLASIGDTFDAGVWVSSQFSLAVASNPGQGAFFTITANGVTFNAAGFGSSYSYVGGVATWVWTSGGPFGFGTGVTYPVTFTGGAFSTSIVSGTNTTGVNGYSPYTLLQITDSFNAGTYVGSGISLSASSDPTQSLFTSITVNGQTYTSASATYNFSGGVATWSWGTGPFGFTSGNSYPISFAGASFFSTIVAGIINFNGLHPISVIGYSTVPGEVIGTNTSLAVFNGFQQSTGTGSIQLLGTSQVNYETGNLTLVLSGPPPVADQIFAQYTQSVPYRVQWSAIGDPTNWPIPLTANAIAFQSGFEDLEVDLGPVKFISGYPLYGVIFQEFGITRANYVGGNVVFSFAVFSRNRGLIARGAACVVGQLVYFIAQDGFQVTDGSTVQPIGTDAQNNMGIDMWFFANVNTNALESIRSAYDTVTRNVYFAIPTGTNTLPDTLLAYNPIAQKWTKSAIPVELLWTDTNAGTTPGSILRLALFTQNHQASTLTGPTLNGYLETCDIMTVDGDQRFTTGIRPNIACNDTPQAKVGVRNSMQDNITYSPQTVPDSFSRIVPAMVTGLYTRANVSSSSAQAFTGATIYQEEGGPV